MKENRIPHLLRLSILWLALLCLLTGCGGTTQESSETQDTAASETAAETAEEATEGTAEETADETEGDYIIPDSPEIYLDGDTLFTYTTLSSDEKLEYGLISEDVTEETEEPYQITEADLGQEMGTVTDASDEQYNGCTAYHYASYPENDAICIVDGPNGYEFFACTYLNYDEEAVGEDFDLVLSYYDLPDSFEEMRVYNWEYGSDGELLFTTTEEEDWNTLYSVLAGKENIGWQERWQQWAQVWYDAFGNTDVYYNEEEGYLDYSQEAKDAEDIDIYEQSGIFFHENVRIIVIVNDRGFKMTIDYYPTTAQCLVDNGTYALSDSEMEILDALLLGDE